MKREHRSLPCEIKSFDMESGVLTGYGAIKNILDRVGDVIEGSNCFGDLAQIVKSGSLCLGHDWGGNPIGYFTTCIEDEKGLYFEAKFHTTEDAQEVRQIVAERMAEGKDVGLSIGYGVKSWEYQDRQGTQVRILKEIEVYEISVVTVPAMPLALATGVKGEPSTGSRFEDAFNNALGEVEDVLQRLEVFHSDRKQGLSEAHRQRLTTLKARIDDLNEKARPPQEELVYRPVPDDLLKSIRKQLRNK